MNSIKKAVRIDKRYKDTLEKYNYKDAVIALLLYIFVMVNYYVMGVVYEKRNIYLGYEVNFFLIVVCICIVLIRNEHINTIGFTKRKLSKSVKLGLILSAVLLVLNLAPGILGGYHLNSASKLIFNFGYYFFVIALTEEIIFRGFIQTRIYGVIKKPFYAVLTTAFLFMIYHVPFQMGAAHMGFFTYILNNYVTLLFTFIWHIVFNFLYSKYNSIAAPTIFHAVVDWCNVLFQ